MNAAPRPPHQAEPPEPEDAKALFGRYYDALHDPRGGASGVILDLQRRLRRRGFSICFIGARDGGKGGRA